MSDKNDKALHEAEERYLEPEDDEPEDDEPEEDDEDDDFEDDGYDEADIDDYNSRHGTDY